MRTLTILLGLLVALNAFAQEPDCVERLASQPYCLSILSATSNCAKPNGEAEAIESCLKGYLAKVRPEKLNDSYRSLLYRMCLADVVIDTQSNKNKSLCGPEITPDEKKILLKIDNKPRDSSSEGKAELEMAPAN